MSDLCLSPGTHRVNPEWLIHDPTIWPRFGWDEQRVNMFADLYEAEGADALPALVILPDGRVIDGAHRARAAMDAGLPEVLVIVERCDNDLAAWRLALRHSSTGPAQVTLKERRAAAVRLLHERPSLTNYAIAKETGLDAEAVERARRVIAAGDDPLAAPSTDPEKMRLRCAGSILAGLDRLRQLVDGDADAVATVLADAAEARYDGDGDDPQRELVVAGELMAAAAGAWG